MNLPAFPDKYDAVQQAVLRGFRLDVMGTHGLPHWARVYRNGLLIAAEDPDVDMEVVALFALLHDSCREDEYDDDMHGVRASRFVAQLHEGDILPPELTREQITLLRAACADHSRGFVINIPTIQACWDADRLDLGRIGIKPELRKLGSRYAQLPGVIERHWEEAWNTEGMESMIEAV